jgi:hypothetical protein
MPGNIYPAKPVLIDAGRLEWRKSSRTAVAMRLLNAREIKSKGETTLRTTQILKFPNQIALVALALCFSAGLGKSQDAYQGKFTLPFEAHWAGATLPAGDYTISMPEAVWPYWLYIRGEKSAIIFAQGVESKEASNDSSLTVTKTGANEAITELHAGQLGMNFDFAVHKTKSKAESESDSMARVNVPVQDVNGPVAGR